MNKFEQFKFENSEQRTEKRSVEILADLDLTIEDLAGKRVLDIGAGNAEIAKVANKKGAMVYSLEHDLGFVKRNFKDFSAKDANYVVAKAEKLPFKDGFFDLLITHGGPPNISSSKEEIEAVVKEGYRVLKPAGEWRIGQGYLSAAAFTDLDLPDSLSAEERMKKIKQAAFDYLKNIWAGQIEEIQKGENVYEMYYKLIKKHE